MGALVTGEELGFGYLLPTTCVHVMMWGVDLGPAVEGSPGCSQHSSELCPSSAGAGNAPEFSSVCAQQSTSCGVQACCSSFLCCILLSGASEMLFFCVRNLFETALFLHGLGKIAVVLADRL